MPQWPATLPVTPLLDSFFETAPQSAIRTEMDQGPAKVRQRTSAAVRNLSMSYFLDGTQVTALDTFYTDTLAGGTLAFDFTHPRTGISLSCRFIKPPEYAAVNGVYYKAALTLEALP